MTFIDTHTHLYLEHFDADREAMVQRALDQGVKHMLLPHIDSQTTDSMMKMARQYPGTCIPMMGLHPTSVKQHWSQELERVEQQLKQGTYCAVGEVGLDFYWDTTYRLQQEQAFVQQISLAMQYSLPLVIHTRNSLEDAIAIVKDFLPPSLPADPPPHPHNVSLSGVFHCFPGTPEQAIEVALMGFYIGIGGVVTYKNSLMAKVVEAISLDHLLLETDAPFLTPHPKRGTRNESSYIPFIAQKIAEIKGVSVSEVAEVTSWNAETLFSLP